MNIVVIGSGYVGTTAAALFAVAGHRVHAIDIDSKKVELINDGRAPFYETGLDNVIKAGIERGLLSATESYEVVKDADAVFSCVGTPDNADGSSNLSYVYSAAEEAAKYLKPGAVYVQKSTVPVGTGREVIKFLPKNTPYVSNPEFLREATAIYDTVMFDRVLAGGDDNEANKKILDLHRSVEDASEAIVEASGLEIDMGRLANHEGEYVQTNLESAELIKVTANAFLALKISFANSIAKLCDAAGADVKQVMSVVGSDARIGKAFFNAGRGYGGGCFPKDVSGLIQSANSFGVDMEIMKAATEVNSSMAGYVVDRLHQAVDFDLNNEPVAVLGLSFKAGTSDVRKSPAIKIANMLVESGAKVRAHDPEAEEEAREHSDLSESIELDNSIADTIKDARLIVLGTDWPEYKDIAALLEAAPKCEVVVDAMNCATTRPPEGIRYVAVGTT